MVSPSEIQNLFQGSLYTIKDGALNFGIFLQYVFKLMHVKSTLL